MKQTWDFKQHLRKLFSVLAIAGTLLGLPSAHAATITVTNNRDSGAGSLRQALADAHNEDSINFDSSLKGQTITLTSGELVVNKIVSINGPGPNNLAVDANHASRVFHVSEGASAGISGLSIVNGSASGLYGGGIYNDHSTLSVINCTLRDNSANASTGAGGGIFNDASYGTATLWVSNCTLTGNSAVNGHGGGICNEGYNGSATLTVLNSTVSRNSAASGGGIYSEGLLVATATLDILNSTLSGNSATFGGGIYARSATSSSATVHVLYSTLSDNSAIASSGGAGIYNDGAIAQLANTVFNASSIFRASGMIGSLGYNLCSDDGSGFLTATSDQINTDPMLGPLQDNGGPTFTHTLLSG
ncbi:MAG TPA: choice-of-anchor Q domain-containing protein, partial [Verrucomicrobiae bacterium]|nr:choice-of-anchor Q domain-containing protein [Verrucomicrobiae bacterium]